MPSSMARSSGCNERRERERKRKSGRWLGKSRITELAKLSNYLGVVACATLSTETASEETNPLNERPKRRTIVMDDLSNFPRVRRTRKRDADNACYLVDGIVVVTNGRCVHSVKIGAGSSLRDRPRERARTETVVSLQIADPVKFHRVTKPGISVDDLKQ